MSLTLESICTYEPPGFFVYLQSPEEFLYLDWALYVFIFPLALTGMSMHVGLGMHLVKTVPCRP